MSTWKVIALSLALMVATALTFAGAAQAAQPAQVAKCLGRWAKTAVKHNNEKHLSRIYVSADYPNGNGVRVFFFAKPSAAHDAYNLFKGTLALSHAVGYVIGSVLVDWNHKPNTTQVGLVKACLPHV